MDETPSLLKESSRPCLTAALGRPGPGPQRQYAGQSTEKLFCRAAIASRARHPQLDRPRTGPGPCQLQPASVCCPAGPRPGPPGSRPTRRAQTTTNAATLQAEAMFAPCFGYRPRHWWPHRCNLDSPGCRAASSIALSEYGHGHGRNSTAKLLPPVHAAQC